jgi:hypothetical protein
MSHFDTSNREEVDERLPTGIGLRFSAGRDGDDGTGHGEGFKMTTLHMIPFVLTHNVFYCFVSPVRWYATTDPFVSSGASGEVALIRKSVHPVGCTCAQEIE